MLAHNVFFSLHDKSPEARAKLINSAKTHLTAHAGVLFFAVGEMADELNRPVNDRDFDVALHIVFAPELVDHGGGMCWAREFQQCGQRLNVGCFDEA